ncbi:MAG: ATP-dependent DNA helicase RecG [Candidatus Omnitrophota bacterium]
MKDPNTPIRYIKGVGPKKSDVFNTLGIGTVEDLLYYLPFRYEDRSHFIRVCDAKEGEVSTIKGEVKTLGSIRTRTGLNIFQLALDDGTGVVYGIWFHQPYLKKIFKVGQKIVMYGKVERHDKLRINHPRYEILKGDDSDSIHVGRIVPVYHLTQELSQRNLRTIAFRAVSDYSRSIQDILSTKMRARNKLVDLAFGIKNIHFPANYESLNRAYKRIVFDEFFLLQLAIAIKKRDRVLGEKGVAHNIDKDKIRDFIESLPFELTDGQHRAIEAIEKDMASSRPMNRLVQGDVGSGKTIVACHALLLAAGNGFQGVFMAPTEILAEQHYLTLTKIFMDLDINVALLVQGISPKERSRILEDAREGRVGVLIGTHAVIQEGVEFKNLGLVVIDEQHKFGVSQRAKLQGGRRPPDVLLMTATPIPRTLAMTVYGDLDISVIRELPPGRGEITTYWVSDAEREKVYDFLREEISKGRQAYVVYPRLEETALEDLRSAKLMYDELKDKIFKDLRVGLIYGKMESKKKDLTMRSFKKGDIDILVSTVVVEVGIDVSNASVMVIENAERFGLSQLHQLRGRIGRGKHESYCVLISDTDKETAQKRLTAMTESQDGFQIAEEDLKLRGPGDVFGTRQHGLPEIRFGNIVRDMEIMEVARREAFSLIAEDPRLDNHENRLIKRALDKRFKERLSLVKVG